MSKFIKLKLDNDDIFFVNKESVTFLTYRNYYDHYSRVVIGVNFMSPNSIRGQESQEFLIGDKFKNETEALDYINELLLQLEE